MGGAVYIACIARSKRNVPCFGLTSAAHRSSGHSPNVLRCAGGRPTCCQHTPPPHPAPHPTHAPTQHDTHPTQHDTLHTHHTDDTHDASAPHPGFEGVAVQEEKHPHADACACVVLVTPSVLPPNQTQPDPGCTCLLTHHPPQQLPSLPFEQDRQSQVVLICFCPFQRTLVQSVPGGGGLFYFLSAL